MAVRALVSPGLYGGGAAVVVAALADQTTTSPSPPNPVRRLLIICFSLDLALAGLLGVALLG